MKKFIYLMILPFMALPFLHGSREEQSVSIPQVVMVNYGCSGFVAAQGFVVTARHCINDQLATKDHEQDTPSIKFWDGVRSDFTIAAYGRDMETNDWAVLRGDTRGIVPMKFASNRPSFGDDCAHAGHGGASAQQLLIYCAVSGYGGLFSAFRNYYMLYSNAIPGDSGSMVVNRKLEVFGILVRSKFPVPFALATDAQLARQAIKRLQRVQ